MSYKKITVMIFGTFDLLHPGHINFIKQAKKCGDYLILILSRNETVKNLKGYYPSEDIETRAHNLALTELVNLIIYGRLDRHYQVIKKYQPDVICLGYDQNHFIDKLDEKIKQYGLKTKVIRLKAYKPERYKTSVIKRYNSARIY